MEDSVTTCRARALRTGKRCGLPALYDVDDDGVADACHLEKHQDEVRQARAIAAALTGRRAAEIDALLQGRDATMLTLTRTVDVDPVVCPLGEPSSGTTAFDRLPEAPAPATLLLDEVETEPVPAPEVAAALEARTLSILGDDLPEDAAKADAAASSSTSGGRAQFRSTAERFTQERVRYYLTVLVEPKFEADGKEPFTDAELDEGSEIGSMILQNFFGESRPSSPGWALLVWATFVVGSRYSEELLNPVGRAIRGVLTQVMRSVRGRRARVRPVPAPPAQPAGPQLVDVEQQLEELDPLVRESIHRRRAADA